MRKTWMFAAVTIGVVAGGCASECGDGKCGHKHADNTRYQDPFFPPTHVKPAATTWFDAAAAAGRAQEATLYPQHFDGNELSSLGVERMEGVIAGRKLNERLNVYLDTSSLKDRSLDADRQATVEKFLLSRGMKSDQFALEAGPNPAAWKPSDRTVRAYNRTTDSEGTTGDTTNIGTVNVSQ
jgi:hypothetical protein